MVIRRWVGKVFWLFLLMTWAFPLLAAPAPAPQKEEFPGRGLYPLVSYIDIKDLYKRFNEVIIVDVRSSYEFETLRLKGAINIPLASPTFVERMRNLRSKELKPIVVYCNGKTCMKSYKAALKCSVNKIQDDRL